MEKPKQRSGLRQAAGKIYYTLFKNIYWHLPPTKFAKTLKAEFLPCEIFTHKSPLIRKLKNVDMWMQHNKVQNLKTAVRRINGLVIKPGEVFSYWRSLGKPTIRKGYLEGMILHNGTVKAGVGGGLCQLSNLVFWMTLHTPLTVIERWHHAYDVFPDEDRKQPFGSGATCAYPFIDLQIKNNTGQNFQLTLEVTNEFLMGKWYSDQPLSFTYEVIEKEHEIKSEWWGGYTRNNKIFRKITDSTNGNLINEEFITENHAIMMYSPMIEAEKK